MLVSLDPMLKLVVSRIQKNVADPRTGREDHLALFANFERLLVRRCDKRGTQHHQCQDYGC